MGSCGEKKNTTNMERVLDDQQEYLYVKKNSKARKSE